MRTAIALTALVFGACTAQSGEVQRSPTSATVPVDAVTASAGAGSESPRYAVEFEVPDTAKAGESVVARLVVEPRAPLHMNLDYPAKLELSQSAGVALDATLLRKGDAERLDNDGLVFPVVFTPAHPGRTTVEGEVHFAVCGVAECAPVKMPVRFSVEIT